MAREMVGQIYSVVDQQVGSRFRMGFPVDRSQSFGDAFELRARGLFVTRAADLAPTVRSYRRLAFEASRLSQPGLTIVV
jgi:hypothetical protein